MIADTEASVDEGTGKPLQVAREPIATPVEMVRSWYMSAARILRSASEAWNANRRFQRYMRLDPDVAAPLLELQLAVCCTPWSIKAENARDKAQKDAASDMAARLRRCPAFLGALKHLTEAVWYGPSAVNFVYEDGAEGAEIVEWRPLHPDSLVFTEEGRLGLKVGMRYKEQTEMGWDSRVRMLTPQERAAVCLHRHFVEAPDHDVQTDAASTFAGRGLRDMVWYPWFLKQTIMQNWAAYCERYGMGIRKGYYEEGNEQAKNAMVGILSNLRGDVNVALAQRSDGTKINDIEVMEPASSGTAEVFAALIEWLTQHMKEMIVGQRTSSEPVSTGLGSNVADKQDQTKRERIRYTAELLADSITRQVVQVMWEIDHGAGAMCPLRFAFALDRQEPEKVLSAAEKASKMGVRIAVRDVRDAIGFREPDEDEECVEMAIDEAIPPSMDDMAAKSALRGRAAK